MARKRAGRLFTVLAASLLLTSVASAKDLADYAFLDRTEAGVLQELNLARTAPAEYIGILQDYRSHIHHGILEYKGEIGIRLSEGTEAVDDAIAFLKRQSSLRPFAISKGLSLAAKDQAKDQGRTGATGHDGSDGSSPFQRMNRYGRWEKSAGENCAYGPDKARQIVIQLIVDDGVPSRGHRLNIFDSAFRTVGIAVGPHPRFGFVCVMDFAGNYEEK